VIEPHVEYERTYAATVAAMPELATAHRVDPCDLTEPGYSHVVEAVQRLVLAGERVTRVSLRAELERMGHEHAAKGNFIEQLGAVEPDIGPIAQRLRELATARRMHADAVRLTATLARGDVAAAREIVGRMQLTHDPSSKLDPVMNYRELLETSLETIIAERSASAKLVAFGIPSIDASYKLSPGSMMVIGAQTNVGKSSLMITALNSICERQIPAGLISVEDPSEDWGAKLIGSLTGINPATTRSSARSSARAICRSRSAS
jgi:replicative DNA helicase